MSGVGYIHELNDAVGRNDLKAFGGGVHPDAVWEHNLGSGSPEEGVYEGRQAVVGLFQRVLEGWEYMRPVATEICELEPGIFHVRGDLHSKHAATQNEIVEPYQQRLEIRGGLVARGWMLVGSSARE